MGDLIDLAIQPETKFEFFSASLLTASVGDNGRKMLHGVASSTTRDLHGDTILRSALDDMERSAVGMTIFRNHSYNVPDDVAGTVTRAIIKQDGVDQDSEPNFSLIFDIEIDEEQEQAVKSWRMIKNGRKLGLSIGAMIPEGGAKRQKNGSYIIEHVLLLETSIVGIPANPKSWIDYAASALRGMAKAKTTELGNPTLTLDGDVYKIEGSLKGLELNLGETPTTPEPSIAYAFRQFDDGKVLITRTIETPQADGAKMAQVTPLGAWHLSDPDDLAMAVATVGQEVIEKATVWVTTRDGDQITIADTPSEGTSADADPDVTKASCSQCGGAQDSPKKDCDSSYHSAASPDPDVTDAKIRVIEVDTDDGSSGDGSQGASDDDSEPADDTLSAPAADVTAAATPEDLEDLPANELMKLGFGQLQATALSLTRQLIETRRALGEVALERDRLLGEREKVAEAGANLVAKVADTIQKVGDIKLLPKARLKGAEQSFVDLSSYYGEEFTQALKGK